MVTQRDGSIELVTAISLGSSCRIVWFSGFTPHLMLGDLAGAIWLCIAFASKITSPVHLDVNYYAGFLDITAVTFHLSSSHVRNFFFLLFLPEKIVHNLITLAV